MAFLHAYSCQLNTLCGFSPFKSIETDNIIYRLFSKRFTLIYTWKKLSSTSIAYSTAARTSCSIIKHDRVIVNIFYFLSFSLLALSVTEMKYWN